MSKHGGYSLENDLMPIIKGKTELPNFEELSLENGVAHIAAGGGLVEINGVNNARVPGMNSNWGTWARYFLMTTQAGSYDGTGYVMFWDKSKVRIGRFAICKHKKVSTGGNPNRGWYPGYCELCGLDMSVDSGD